MAVTPRVLIPSKAVTTGLQQQYLSPTPGLGTIIDKFVAHNTGGVAASITVHLVSDGSASSNDKLVAKSLAGGETYTFPEIAGSFLAPGDTITTDAVASGINIRASGRELT